MSFYVDYVANNVVNQDSLEKFIRQFKEIMSNEFFDLRQWEYSDDCQNYNDKRETHVLELIWNKKLDTLRIDISFLSDMNMEKIT